MSFLYLVVLALLLALSTIIVLFMKHFKNIFITNVIFICVSTICYISVVIIALIKNGPNDWNFLNTLPTANVSPFMFCITPLYLILPKKIRQYLGALIALLCVGMILSPMISSIYFFSIIYKYHFSFTIDYIAHFSLALFGIYLVQSKQIELNLKQVLIGGGIIICVALIMVVINLIFDTSFFGLSLRGKHNIYNQVLVSNSFLSALIYFTGLILVLVSSFGFQKLLLNLIKQ